MELQPGSPEWFAQMSATNGQANLINAFNANSAKAAQGIRDTTTQNASGLYYDDNSADSYLNAMNQQAAWMRDDAIRKEGYAREDTYYQRLFSDLEKAGANPALLISNASGGGYSGISSASTFQKSNLASEKNMKWNQIMSTVTSAAKLVSASAALVGAIGMAAK